jgi:PRC-barrel domain
VLPKFGKRFEKVAAMQRALLTIMVLLAGCTSSNQDNDRQLDWLSRSFVGAAVLTETGQPIGRVDTVLLAPDGSIAAIRVAGTDNSSPQHIPLQEVRLFSDPVGGWWFKHEVGLRDSAR